MVSQLLEQLREESLEPGTRWMRISTLWPNIEGRRHGRLDALGQNWSCGPVRRRRVSVSAFDMALAVDEVGHHARLTRCDKSTYLLPVLKFVQSSRVDIEDHAAVEGPVCLPIVQDHDQHVRPPSASRALSQRSCD